MSQTNSFSTLTDEELQQRQKELETAAQGFAMSGFDNPTSESEYKAVKAELERRKKS